jgi:DNA-binding CsgD family transcriptional regulator
MEGAAALPRGGALPVCPTAATSGWRRAAHVLAGSERRFARHGRYVHSPLAVHRRRSAAFGPAVTPGPSPAVGTPRRRGDSRRPHAIRSRHPAASGSRTLLIEREPEVDVLRTAVARLAGGAGGIVVLAAPAGLGKTALLEHAAQQSTRAGCRVRRAAPGPLERHFGFGVVRALLEGPLRDASPEQRARLLEGAAAPAGALLLDGAVPGADATMAIAHSVLWLCSALADDAPLVLVVDDAHWADRPSLEVLAYLARRIADLPLLVAVGARAEDPDAAADLLTLIGGAPAATVLHPQPLTAPGATQLIRRAAPFTPFAVCRDCHRAAAGNPWLLGELGRQIADHGVSALDESQGDAPPLSAMARNVVRGRLAELSERNRAVAQAVAVIGEGAPRQVIAAVAGVALHEVGHARDGLLAAGLIDADAGRFVHHLIAGAIADGLPRAQRQRLHRETARALMATGADADSVASHLLRCGAEGDPEVSALLRDAAAEAARHGAPHTAAAYLERALKERAPGDDRGGMLAELATVAFDAGLPDSRQRMREALAEAHDRDSRLDVLTRLAALNVVDLDEPGLSALFEHELAAESDPRTRLAIEVAALDTLITVPSRHEERARRVAAIDADAIADPVLRRSVLAHRAWTGTERGVPDAPACAALAREALEGDELLHDAGRRAAYHLGTRALVMADHADEARTAIARLRDHAVQRGSLRLHAAAAWYAADLALRCGRVAEAEDEARTALCLVDEDVSVLAGGSASVLVGALAERGAFDEARDVLRERGLDGDMEGMPWESAVIHARARLWLAEGDYERALAEAVVSGRLREERGRPNPTWAPWRSTAALALAHLGRRDEAAAMADAGLAPAERFGAPLAIAGALHARAVAEPDAAARVALCERALALAAGTPALLESVRARLELGSTLAHMGRRVEARDALRPALADADAAGAVLLAQRARRELVATGLRPRQAALEGVAALTPRQRQVCELAAAGRGNRQIAQALFLSIKTVETHLAAGYRKLGVSTRADLAAQLAR